MAPKERTAGDLTRVVGIGEQIAARLRAAGLDSVRRLAGATVDQVVAACGPGLAPRVRAASWIEQAVALADRPRTSEAGPAPRTRRMFTVDVRLDGRPPQPVTTRVVQVETQEADGWPGWDPRRLVEFVERRLGPAARAAQAAPAESPAAAPAGPAVGNGSVAAAGVDDDRPELAVHRFGLLKAATPLMRGGEAMARLHIDPTELELPEQGSAVAQVDLLAQAIGTGREQVLDTLVIELPRTHSVDARLRGPLPDRDPPFALSAIVRVLVGQPTGPPRADLGGAVLDVVAGNGAG